jgi:NAD(P) transhydrogenase subunit alpha
VTIDHILAGLYVFSLAAFLGYQIISKVPQLLHTPLMAFTNAISGISLVASLLIAGRKADSLLIPILGAVAVASATINVVGGFVITDRMLKMFKKKEAPK